PSWPRTRRRRRNHGRALASPASLKGVLSAREAAAVLAEGLCRGGADAEELPLADGGEGTADVLGARVRERVRVHDAFGRPREAPIRELADGTALVESAEVMPLSPPSVPSSSPVRGTCSSCFASAIACARRT